MFQSIMLPKLGVNWLNVCGDVIGFNSSVGDIYLISLHQLSIEIKAMLKNMGGGKGHLINKQLLTIDPFHRPLE